LGTTHPVEIVRYGDLSGHESQPANLPAGGHFERRDFDQRLPRLGDDERLALGRAVDQPRQMGLGFVDIDSQHCTTDGLSRISLVPYYTGGNLAIPGRNPGYATREDSDRSRRRNGASETLCASAVSPLIRPSRSPDQGTRPLFFYSASKLVNI